MAAVQTAPVKNCDIWQRKARRRCEGLLPMGTSGVFLDNKRSCEYQGASVSEGDEGREAGGCWEDMGQE